jgi:carbamoyl-phosphate synthase large subunit
LIGTKIALSSKKAIEIANDKYRLMCLANNVGVPTPEYYLVDSLLDLLKYSEKLGWPEKPIVIKPPVSNGMRGVRIVDEHRNLKDMLYSEKPMNLYTHMDYLKMVLGNSFPPLLVMEYLPYEEWTVDVFSGNDITAVTRKRDNIRSGITFEGTCIKNEYMIDYSILLSKAIGLEYAFGFQFKLDSNHVPKLLESNPRIQGTMVLSTFADVNIIYAAVKYALGEEVAKLNPSWGTKIMRYWGGIGINDHTVLGKL